MASTPDAGGPDTNSPEELRADIARTREELGDTLEELAAMADIKSQARAKAAHTTAQVRVKAAEATARTQEKAAHAKEQLTHTAAELGSRAQERTPKQLRTAASKAADTGRSHPVPLAVAGVLLLLAGLAVRGRGHTGRRRGGVARHRWC